MHYLLPIIRNEIHSILIDDEDLELIKKLNAWKISGNGNVISSSLYGQNDSLSRRLINYHGPLEVDHKDKNWKNFQKINLRVATRQQQMANSYPQLQRKYKGVWFLKNLDTKPFRARIKVNQKGIHLGYYSTENEAALAYNIAAVKYFGEFAYVNKIK